MPYYKQRPKREKGSLVFGVHPVNEMLDSEAQVDKIFVQKGVKNDQIQAIHAKAFELEVPVQVVPVEKINRILGNTELNHQGVIAFKAAVHYVKVEEIIARAYEQGHDPFVIVLDRITDVRNFGAIARTAECAGVDAIVIPMKGGAQVNADAMKTSAGALNHISVCRESSLTNCVKILKENGLKVVACTEKTQDSLYDAELTGPLAIVMGSEEDGISPEILKMVDERRALPMKGKIGSLNVSVAAALMSYEALRQRS